MDQDMLKNWDDPNIKSDMEDADDLIQMLREETNITRARYNVMFRKMVSAGKEIIKLETKISESKARVIKLKEAVKFFLKAWDGCSEVGYCPELGYPVEDWCPYCKYTELLKQHASTGE